MFERRLYYHVDWAMLAAILALCMIGVVQIYSATGGSSLYVTQLYGIALGFTALVIGPGGGRDLLSALLFGARRVEGVEINPIIVRDVMLGRFREYSGAIYADPRVSIHVEDGRSFVRRSRDRYDGVGGGEGHLSRGLTAVRR